MQRKLICGSPDANRLYKSGQDRVLWGRKRWPENNDTYELREQFRNRGLSMPYDVGLYADVHNYSTWCDMPFIRAAEIAAHIFEQEKR